MRNNSFVPASKLMAGAPSSKYHFAANPNSSDISSSSSFVVNDAKPSIEVSESLTDPQVGFRRASELLPSQHSDHVTSTQQPTKMDETPVDAAQTSTSSILKSTTSASGLNSSAVDHLSKEISIRDGILIYAAMKAESDRRKRKIDPAVAKSRKITSFFEK